MPSQQIPIEILSIQNSPQNEVWMQPIMENEINGIEVQHCIIPAEQVWSEEEAEGHRSIYLFIKGEGDAVVNQVRYTIAPETILIPTAAAQIELKASQTMHYLKISSRLSEEDLKDIITYPKESVEQVYFKQFKDCPSYSEPIKSPNTISRTIMPNKIIPRIAMGTVETIGPDEVGAHKHPMLEQLFLGLAKNDCTVYADDAQVSFPEHSLLHIPLGSMHSVSVDKDKVMYYIWMDFFLNKEGEEWLKTHIED